MVECIEKRPKDGNISFVQRTAAGMGKAWDPVLQKPKKSWLNFDVVSRK
jgi:hypothetical protein